MIWHISCSNPFGGICHNSNKSSETRKWFNRLIDRPSMLNHVDFLPIVGKSIASHVWYEQPKFIYFNYVLGLRSPFPFFSWGDALKSPPINHNLDLKLFFLTWWDHTKTSIFPQVNTVSTHLQLCIKHQSVSNPHSNLENQYHWKRIEWRKNIFSICLEVLLTSPKRV